MSIYVYQRFINVLKTEIYTPMLQNTNETGMQPFPLESPLANAASTYPTTTMKEASLDLLLRTACAKPL